MTKPPFRRRRGADDRTLSLLGCFLQEVAEVYALPTGEHALHLLETGRMTEAEYFARLCDRHAASGQPRLDPVAAREMLVGRPMVASEVMIDAVRRLRGAGISTALLTNSVREWEAGWRPLMPFDELFDVLIDSSVVGLRKPDPEIYRLTCRRLALDPSDCLFVDDLECNVEAARAVGMHALHCTNAEVTAAEVLRLLTEGGG
jgi:putative hydrolase of the HAD superfamily